jgi:adenylate cyclase
MIEIERKYLVTSNEFVKEAFAKNEIQQGYLNSDKNRTVRIRTKNDKGYLTIKGKSNQSGTTRLEWEKEIEFDEAQMLLSLCEKGVIKKTRYEIKCGKHTIEVDVFYDENEGLILAEIELENEDETIEKPSWLGIEVTNDERYYNAFISNNPFKSWV